MIRVVAQMLINEEKMKKIEESSEQLNQQSLQFKQSTKELQNKMFWKVNATFQSAICSENVNIDVENAASHRRTHYHRSDHHYRACCRKQ